ncbi:FAD-binding protein [Streptomyces sp. NPDC002476]|uniref:FAD-binding protein n=1 Tax=Streptomyces sp. NPDC002476 TaxID=3364648 RepID=UPI0036A13EFA
MPPRADPGPGPGLGARPSTASLNSWGPLEAGQFCAVRVQGALVTGTVGFAVDQRLRVLREEGKPIGGLYAVGKVMIGSAQLMGLAPLRGRLHQVPPAPDMVRRDRHCVPPPDGGGTHAQAPFPDRVTLAGPSLLGGPRWVPVERPTGTAW